MSINNCPACGAGIAVPGAKFCQSCGAPLPQETGLAEAPPASFNVNPQYSAPTFAPPPQYVVGVPQKLVAGAMLKSVPFANMIVEGGKIGGSIQLRRDGVLFITSAKEVIQSHVSDIADVTEGEGKNVIIIAMTNGEHRTFAFAGARRWIEKIYKLQGR